MAKNFLEQITIRAVAEGFDKVNQQLEKVGKSAEVLSGKLESIGKSLSIKVTAPIAAFGALAVREFAQAEKAAAKVQAQLELTGEAVGLTFKELQQASEDLQKNSIFGDDEILEKVSGQLLRVSGLTKDTFLEAQQVVIDLASALDTDLGSAALKVAKALESPADALGSLERDNIKFTKSQKDLIDGLIKTGREAEAQGLILDILRSKFEGVGRAVSQTAFGQLAQLKNAFANLAEVIGGRLFTILTPLVEKLTAIFQTLQKANLEVFDFVVKIGLVAAAIGPLSLALSVLVSPLSIALGVAVALTSTLDFLATKFDAVRKSVSFFQGLLSGVATILTTFLAAVTLVVSELNELTGIFGRENQSKIDSFGKKLTELGLSLQEFSVSSLKGEGGEVFSINDLFSDVQKFLDEVAKMGEKTKNSFQKGLNTKPTPTIPVTVVGIEEQNRRIVTEFEKNKERIQPFLDDISNSFGSFLTNVQSGVKGIGDAFQDLGRTIVNSLFNTAVQRALGSLFDGLGNILAGGNFNGPNTIQGPPPGFAEGGPVNGPGSGTSDSILARLSNGEFVVNSESTKLFRPLLDFINGTRKGFFPKSRFGMPAFAGGGEASGNSGVTVNVINNSSQPVNARSNTRFDGRQIIIDTFLEDARINGPMSQSIQNLYGVRR